MLVERGPRRVRPHHQEGGRPDRGVLLQPIADAETVHPVQLGAHDDQVEAIGDGPCEPGVSLGDDRHLAPERHERPFHVERKGTVVLEQKDPGAQGSIERYPLRYVNRP